MDAGDTLNWNHHIHLLSTLGCFTEKFRYYNVDFIPYKVIAGKWQVEVLKLLIKYRLITRDEGGYKNPAVIARNDNDGAISRDCGTCII